MTDTGGRGRFAPVAIALLSILVGTVVFLAWPRVARFSSLGISFDVPSGWTIHDDLPPSTGPGQILALIGNMPWGPCEASDINCHFQERFGRHEIEIQVGIGHLPGRNFCSYAVDEAAQPPRTDGIRVAERHYFRIDGRPAIATYYSLETTDYYLSDGWREWEIAPADTTQALYRIHARWRGPGDQEFLDALDRMVASIDLGPSGFGQATFDDCGDPFPPLHSLAPGQTATPAPTPSPTAIPEARIDCHGEAGPLPPMLSDDPCPDAIAAVEQAVPSVGLPIARIVIEPGPFYCDVVWPGIGSPAVCFGTMVRPGQFMHAWVAFHDTDRVAAVMLGLDLPDSLDVPGATRPPWHATVVTVEVPPAGWVMP